MINAIRNRLAAIMTTTPEGSLLILAMWSLCNAMTMLFGVEPFAHGHLFDVLRTLPLDRYEWGMLMLGDGLLLLSTIVINHATFRAVVSSLSAFFWLNVGYFILCSCYLHHAVYIAGPFSTFIGLFTLLSAGRWALGGK